MNVANQDPQPTVYEGNAPGGMLGFFLDSIFKKCLL